MNAVHTHIHLAGERFDVLDEEFLTSATSGMPGSAFPNDRPRQAQVIEIRGGRREDLVSCEDLLQAADERSALSTAAVINALILSLALMVSAFVLIELVLHAEDIARWL